LGCVMYEMLTGRRAFTGDSVPAILSAILRDDPPPVSQFAPGVPPELERIVRRCLKKDPRKRWQQMPDLRVALEELRDETTVPADSTPPLEPPAEKRRRSNWILTAFAVSVLAAVGVAWWRNLRNSEAQQQSPSRNVLTRMTSDSGLTSFPAVSPDGSLVAYASDRGGEGNLDIWVQQMAGAEPIQLTRGKADEYEPVFAPDGSRIAFRSEADGGGLYLVSALGGEPRRLVQSGRSARFSPDGRQLLFAIGSPGVGGAFSTGVSSIYSVGVDGGEPRRLAPDFVSALHPNWTTDGKQILFLGSRSPSPGDFDLWALPAAGGEPVATGAVKALRAQGFGGNPEPFAVHGDSVILSLRLGDSANLWRIVLAGNPLRLAGQVEQLTRGTGLERLPSVSRNGKIVFSAGQENSDLWELPLDANRGDVKGEARRITHDAADDFFPSLAANGSRIAFISRRGGNDDVWTIDTASGKASPLLTTPAAEYYPKLSRDGSLVVFGSMSTDRRSMFMMSTSSGVATRLCDDCGVVRDLSADGSKVLLQVGPPAHIAIMDAGSRQVTPLYRHPKFQTYAPKLSADEKWAAFQTVEQPTTRTIYVAPFRNQGGPVESEEWIKVSNGRFLDRNPVWSPNGALLYFLSERDTFRCIWAQRLNMANHKPLGEPFPVAHFHEAVRSLMNIDGPGQIGVSVGPDRLVYAAGELKGNIWYSQLR
jgi:eukaryotic-like serine/threonine-protein kinase